MIVDSNVIAACANLKYTYFELGRAASASRIWEETGFKACSGDFAHPICNFAANLKLDFVSAGRLADLALSRPCFNVYNMPDDVPSDCSRLLREAGFVKSYSLSQMNAYGVEAHPKASLHRATVYSDRMEIALFMVEQFFDDQPLPFRRKVAEATARATNLEMLEYRRSDRRVGALLVSLNCGVAGIYNLCIDKAVRGTGLGTNMVLETLVVCSLKGLQATLQCSPKLEQWYGKLGFRKCGEVEVFTFPTPANSVIMH